MSDGRRGEREGEGWRGCESGRRTNSCKRAVTKGGREEICDSKSCVSESTFVKGGGTVIKGLDVAVGREQLSKAGRALFWGATEMAVVRKQSYKA